jgi:hypothetical protein
VRDRGIIKTVKAKRASTKTAKPRSDITQVLKGVPVNHWAVLSPDRKTLLASAKTLATAMKKAESALHGATPYVVQVPDPELVCFY